MEFKRPDVPLTAEGAAICDAVGELARRIPDKDGTGIVSINGGQYIVKPTDKYLVCDARGGAIRIVLPIPKIPQTLTVKNAHTTTNAVTIARTDGKPFGSGVAFVVVSPIGSNPASNFLCDGSEWWTL